MSTLDRYTDLPSAAQKHLAALEEFIGDVDGKDLTQWSGEGEGMTGLDLGTIDAGPAVVAFNGLVALLRGNL